MGEEINFPDARDPQSTTVTDGFFEREIYLSREATATFLRELAAGIEADTTVTIAGDEWEIPFEYSEPIEVEVEFTSRRERELEIEIEFTEPRGGGELNVS